MTRKFISFQVADPPRIKLQMLNWCNQFNICSFLDNHSYQLSHHSIECILAAGCKTSITANAGSAFSSLYDFHHRQNDWIFGHLAYDLKNEIEQLTSSNTDRVKFPDLFFFVPEVIIELKASSISIGSANNDHREICSLFDLL